MFDCVFVTFPCGILGQVWYLIVSIPDLGRLSYFKWKVEEETIQHIYCYELWKMIENATRFQSEIITQQIMNLYLQ